MSNPYRYNDDSTISKGFQLGELPIKGEFSETLFSTDTKMVTIGGRVILEQSGETIRGVLVLIGSYPLDCKHCPITIRHRAVTDSTGAFILHGVIDIHDKLIITGWPFIADIYDIGEIINQ
jgi:hypothetical protein